MFGIIGSSGLTDLEFVLGSLVVFFTVAKVMSTMCEAIHVPGIVGELCAGILLGNLHLLVPELSSWRDQILGSEFMQIGSELGVIFLLFVVGLETSMKSMMKVGASSLLVAIIGVVSPFVMGYLSGFMVPHLSLSNIEKIFLGAALTATSVGITAKVLIDAKALHSQEGQTILGAAVFDDIIGLMILAVVSGLASGSGLSMQLLALIGFKVVIFFSLALLVGHFILPHMIRIPARWRTTGMMQSVAIIVMMALSLAAGEMGLAPIVGAFLAGLLLEETYFEAYAEYKQFKLHQIMGPLTGLFLPLFFVIMGMRVELDVLSTVPIVLATVILTVVAIIGKMVSGLGLLKSAGDRMVVGFGMIPRGEVGLVFAAVGLHSGVIERDFYGVIVMVVILTTIIAPILLRLRLKKTAGSRVHVG